MELKHWLEAIREVAEKAVNEHESDQLRLEMILKLALKGLEEAGSSV